MSKRIENVIYILTNPQYPGYVKIGYASDLQSRVSTLNTGMLIPFSPYAVYETSLHNADVEIHAIIKLLNPILRASNFDKKGKVQVKEFFKLEPEEAFNLLAHIAKLTGTENKLYKVTADFQRIQQQMSQVDVVKPVKVDPVVPPPVVPDDIYYLKRKVKKWNNRTITATVKVDGGKWIVQPGSVICPLYAGDYVKDEIGHVRESVRIVDDILKDECSFDSPSAAATFCVGWHCNGWWDWKLSDGRPVDIYRKKV